MTDPADEDSRSNTDFDAKAASAEHETMTAVKSEVRKHSRAFLGSGQQRLHTPSRLNPAANEETDQAEDQPTLADGNAFTGSGQSPRAGRYQAREGQHKINKLKREGNIPVGPSTGQEDKDAVYLRKTANWYITTFMAMHYGRGRFEDLHNSETTWDTLNDRSEELDKLGHMIKSLWFDLRRILAVFGFPYPTYPEPEDLIGEPEPEEMWEVIWDLLVEISCVLTKDIRIGLSRKERVGEYVSSILVLLDLLKEEIVDLRRVLQAESKSLSFGFASQSRDEGVREWFSTLQSVGVYRYLKILEFVANLGKLDLQSEWRAQATWSLI
ncbi:hypothetical protein IQ07DRAFT_638519 [Pyrenochaeta sp. DS3sAY3a]|nr:hypothetical protein IQ07DRAFT_638519 [Pyrenochaeta sp. DS3sAY3a]